MNESPLFDEFSIFWAGCELELETCPEHFCVVGAPGSGKTVTMKLLMHSVLSKITPGSGRRAMIYDPKRDVMPFLAALRLPSNSLPGLHEEVPVFLLNPFDKRGVPWDICKDIRTPSDTIELAALIVPEGASQNQSYFRDGPRDLIAQIASVFIQKCRNSWTLRDLILALSSRERMLLIASEFPAVLAIVSTYLASGKNGDGAELLTSLNTYLFKFRPLAAAWHQAQLRQIRKNPAKEPEMFSVKSWTEGESIVVLGSHPKFGEVMRSLYQLLFRLSAQTLRAKEDLRHEPFEEATAYSWLFFDELRSAGKFEGLPELLVEGRSKGISLTLGFQDMPGLTHVYGQELAQEIVGICANRLFLYMADAKTIEFASQSLGQVTKEIHKITVGESFGREYSTKRDVSVDQQEKPLLPPSKFSEIRRPVTGRIGISGYAQTERIGIHKVELSPAFLKKVLDPYNTEESKHVSGLESITARDEYLQEWTLQELTGRLHLAKIANLLLGIVPAKPEDPPPPDEDEGDSGDYGVLGQV